MMVLWRAEGWPFLRLVASAEIADLKSEISEAGRADSLALEWLMGSDGPEALIGREESGALMGRGLSERE